MDSLVGIDIGGTNVKIGIVRHGQEFGVVKHASIPFHSQEPPQNFVQRVSDTVKGLITQSGDTVKGVGIGCPGLIAPGPGTILKSPNLPNLVGFPLADAFRKSLAIGCEMQNDANAAALGEVLFGPSKGIRNLILFTLGTGVGGGVICDGHLLQGADNAGGELGHMKVEFNDGALCGCGSKGCLEAYAGAAGISKIARELIDSGGKSSLTPDKLSTKDIAAAARAGDAIAKKAMERVGHYIGRATGVLIDIFNPEKVVIGGGASAAFDLLESGLRAAVAQYASFPETKSRCKIERSAFPDDINVIGAAATYLNLHR